MASIEKILVVDDNEDCSYIARLFLETCGYTVVEANSGTQALLLAAAFSPDVALLDIAMPGVDGFNLARALRRYHPSGATGLIAYTGWMGESIGAAVSAAGFDILLYKPATCEQLLHAVEAAAIGAQAQPPRRVSEGCAELIRFPRY